MNDACNVCGCTLDDEMCLNPDCYPCGVRDERGRFRKKLIRCRVCGGSMLNQQFSGMQVWPTGCTASASKRREGEGVTDDP